MSEEEEEKARMAIEKMKESDDRTDFRVYDCPTELKNELISMAKLYYDNEMWRVLAESLELLKKEKDGDLDGRYAELEGRVSRLEEQVQVQQMLEKNTRNEEQQKPDRPLGFGEADERTKSDIDALKDIRGDD